MEALVALLVMSVGLLSIASVQLHSLRFSQSSFERSIAVLHAHTAIERLWAGACELYEGAGNDRRVNAQALERISNAWGADYSPPGSAGDMVATIEAETFGNDTVFTISVPTPGSPDNDRDDSFRYQTTVPDLRCDSP